MEVTPSGIFSHTNIAIANINNPSVIMIGFITSPFVIYDIVSNIIYIFQYKSLLVNKIFLLFPIFPSLSYFRFFLNDFRQGTIPEKMLQFFLTYNRGAINVIFPKKKYLKKGIISTNI